MNDQLNIFSNSVPQYSIRLVRERPMDGPLILNVMTATEAATEILQDFDREVFLALFLSTSGKLCGFNICHIGSLSESLVRIADVFKAAILSNAAAVIFAHNHPSGNSEPSREDIAVTKRLVAAGQIIGIPVRDHVIITSRGESTSLATRGHLDLD
jgi:DNA repair protein RadC